MTERKSVKAKTEEKKASNDQTLQVDWSFFAFIATTSADDVVMVVIRVWEGIWGVQLSFSLSE